MEEAGRIRRGYFVDGLGAAQFALPGAVDRLRAMRDQPGELAGDRGRIVQLLAAADPANPYGAALAWPRRGDGDRRPFQRAAGAYVALVDGAAVALPGPRRVVDPDPPGRRRPGGARRRARVPPRPRRRRPGPRARHRARSTASRSRRRRSATRCSPPASSRATAATRCARRPPARCAEAMPEGDTLARTAAGLRPYLVGREVAAARARPPGPQVERLVGSTVTAVEAQGKNLLIRFDNGLEVRTHLRMRGSWHRYRPGERVAPAAGPGAARASRCRARSPCASTPRRSSCSSSGRRRCTRRSRSSGRTCSRDPVDVDEAMRRLRDPSRGDLDDRRGAARPAGAGRASATRSRTWSCGRRDGRRGPGSATSTTPRSAG